MIHYVHTRTPFDVAYHPVVGLDAYWQSIPVDRELFVHLPSPRSIRNTRRWESTNQTPRIEKMYDHGCLVGSSPSSTKPTKLDAYHTIHGWL